MGHRITVMVMMGGRSGEHEVSLNSARSILTTLDPQKYEIIPVGITQEGIWFTAQDPLAILESGQTQDLTRVTLLPYPGSRSLYAINGAQLAPLAEIDVVFPALHGTFGEDGTLQGMLELADLPYVGAGVLGSAAGMDKALFKDVMRANGIPVLPSIVTTRDQLEKGLAAVIQQAEEALTYPIFTKPANLGSSVGVTKCRNRSDLMEGLHGSGALRPPGAGRNGPRKTSRNRNECVGQCRTHRFPARRGHPARRFLQLPRQIPG